MCGPVPGSHAGSLSPPPCPPAPVPSPPAPAASPGDANHWHQPGRHAHPSPGPARPGPTPGSIRPSAAPLPPPGLCGSRSIQLICIMMKPSGAGRAWGGWEEICPVLPRDTRGSAGPGEGGAPGRGAGARGAGSAPAQHSSAPSPAEPVSSWPRGGKTAHGWKPAGRRAQSASSRRGPGRPGS